MGDVVGDPELLPIVIVAAIVLFAGIAIVVFLFRRLARQERAVLASGMSEAEKRQALAVIQQRRELLRSVFSGNHDPADGFGSGGI